MKITAKSIEGHLIKWQKIKKAWEAPVIPDDEATDENLTLFIFQSYLHIQSVADVSDKINSLGFRKNSSSGRRINYIPTDISDIIRNREIEDQDLQFACREIIGENTKAVGKKY